VTLSLLSTDATHRVVYTVLINWRRTGSRAYSAGADQYTYHHSLVILLSEPAHALSVSPAGFE